MAFKVIITAKRSGAGTLSREYHFADDPNPDELLDALKEARKEYAAVFPGSGSPITDVTVRRVT